MLALVCRIVKCTKQFPWNESTQPWKGNQYDQFLFALLCWLPCALSDWKAFTADGQVWQIPAGQFFVQKLRSGLTFLSTLSTQHSFKQLGLFSWAPNFTAGLTLMFSVSCSHARILPFFFFWLGVLRIAWIDFLIYIALEIIKNLVSTFDFTSYACTISLHPRPPSWNRSAFQL